MSSTTPKSLKKFPFTSSERELIVALVGDRPIIEDKRTNAINIDLKRKAWEELAVSFNSQQYVTPRNSKQLKRCWENIKTQRKRELSQESSYMTGTGGGPSQGDSSASIDNIVDVICPFINLKVPGVIDSNTAEIPDDNKYNMKNINKTIITVTDKDSSSVEKKECKKRKPDFDAQEVLIDITNYSRDENENFEKNMPSQQKQEHFNQSGTTSVGKNKVSHEIEARLKRCNKAIQQDQELHMLRMEREKILIEREKNILKFEKDLHALQLEKLSLEIAIIKNNTLGTDRTN